MHILPKNVQVTDHARKHYRNRVLAEIHDVRVLNNLTEQQVTELIQEAVSRAKSGRAVRERLSPWLGLFQQPKGKEKRDIYYDEETHAVLLCTRPNLIERVVITCFRATCKACGEHYCKCGTGFASMVN